MKSLRSIFKNAAIGGSLTLAFVALVSPTPLAPVFFATVTGTAIIFNVAVEGLMTYLQSDDDKAKPDLHEMVVRSAATVVAGLTAGIFMILP